ncbi:MAG TPA: DUF2141 domain-containing protein [Polyangia bacterium]|jgi:uncharacterized protein (DUF2141 family)
MTPTVGRAARRVVSTGLLVCTLLLGGGAVRATPPAAAAGTAHGPAATITVRVLGLRNDKGKVRCALFHSPNGFPTKPDRGLGTERSLIQHREAVLVFAGHPPGTYALACFHDENNNSKLDTNWLGIPKEGYGFSNDVRVHFSPPRFEQARFAVRAPTTAIALHIRY